MPAPPMNAPEFAARQPHFNMLDARSRREHVEGQRINNALGRVTEKYADQNAQMGLETGAQNLEVGRSNLKETAMKAFAGVGYNMSQADPQTQATWMEEIRRNGMMNSYAQTLGVDMATATPETFMSIVTQAHGIANTDLPSDVRNDMYYKSLSPDQQANYLQRRRSGQLTSIGGGVDYVLPGGPGQSGGGVQNLSPPQAEFDAVQNVSAAQDRGTSGGINLTPAQRAVDTSFAPQYADWTAGGGFSSVQKNLDQLNTSLGILRTDDSITGAGRGAMPDFLRAFTNPGAVNVKEEITEVVQRNLRLILGAQFTEREGERLIARAYNDRLDESINASRVQRLFTQIQTAAMAKDQASRYYEENGTLVGWEGSLWGHEDFDPRDVEINNPVSVSSDEQFNNLPVGTIYFNADDPEQIAREKQ